MLTKLVHRRNDFVFTRPRSGELLLSARKDGVVRSTPRRRLDSFQPLSKAVARARHRPGGWRDGVVRSTPRRRLDSFQPLSKAVARARHRPGAGEMV